VKQRGEVEEEVAEGGRGVFDEFLQEFHTRNSIFARDRSRISPFSLQKLCIKHGRLNGYVSPETRALCGIH